MQEEGFSAEQQSRSREIAIMKLIILTLFTLTLLGCNSSAPTQIANSNTNSSETRPIRSGTAQNTIAHSTENMPQKPVDPSSANGGKWSQSGDPIDTSRFDGVIAEAEKAVSAKPGDEAAKKALAQAYYDRGDALTKARQYASALGDYRRALKYDPSHEDAKSWIDQIIGIYSMMKKEYPKEGEEPPPLSFKK